MECDQLLSGLLHRDNDCIQCANQFWWNPHGLSNMFPNVTNCKLRDIFPCSFDFIFLFMDSLPRIMAV